MDDAALGATRQFVSSHPSHGRRTPIGAHIGKDLGPAGQQVAKEQYGDEEAAIPTSYKGKARAAVISEHMERVADNLGICKWLYGLFIFQDVDMAMNVFNLATGKDWELEKILGVSERVRNLERMFDVRQGLRRKDDNLPKKFFDQPLKK